MSKQNGKDISAVSPVEGGRRPTGTEETKATPKRFWAQHKTGGVIVKKIIEMEKYFASLKEIYKIAQLKTVHKELIQLRTSVDETNNNLKELFHISGAED